MVDVVSEIVIEKPLEVVSAFAAEPDNAPIWYDNIKSVEWLTEKPLRVGAKIAFKAAFLGRQLAYTYQITELIPDARLVMQTAEGPFPMQTTYTWQAIGPNQTRMTLRNAGKPSGFSKLVAPFMAGMMRKANSKDLQKLKAILETK